MQVAHATAQEVCLKSWVVVNVTACTDNIGVQASWHVHRCTMLPLGFIVTKSKPSSSA